MEALNYDSLNYDSLRSELADLDTLEEDFIVYEPYTGQFLLCNKSIIDNVTDQLNNTIAAKEEVSLYDVYEALGLERGLSREDTIRAKNWFFNN